MIVVPPLVTAAKAVVAFVWQPALAGATMSAATHVVVTPSDQLSFSGTLREAAIGAATSALTAGALSGAGTVLAKCSDVKKVADAVQLGKQVADTRVVDIAKQAAIGVAKVVEAYPEQTQVGVGALVAVGARVVDATLRDTEVTGTDLLKAAVGSSLGNAIEAYNPVKILPGVEAGVSGAVIRAAENMIDEKPLLEGTRQAFLTSSFSSQILTKANAYINSTKPDLETPDSAKHTLAKSALKGTVDGITQWPNTVSKTAIVKPSTSAASFQIDLQPIKDLLIRHQALFRLTPAQIENFCSRVQSLQEGEIRVCHASFSECPKDTDYSVYLIVKRSGDSLISEIYRYELPGKSTPPLKSKL